MANLCRICNKRLLRHAKQLCCGSCGESCHLKCLPNVKPTDSIYINRDSDNWLCMPCNQSIFPFNHIGSDYEFYNILSENSGLVNENNLSQLVFNPFDNFDDGPFFQSPLLECDPDLQYYNDVTNVDNVSQCEYYSEEVFKKKLADLGVNNECFSMLQLNIRSIPKNLTHFQQFVSNLSFNFTVLGFTETWLNENNASLYSIAGYDHYYLCRSGRRGGGLSIFVNENISVTVRHDLNIMSSSIECLFVEISGKFLNTPKDIIIGLLYRPPNQDVTIFTETIKEILFKVEKEKKVIYLMGDFNINILETDNHSPSNEFLDAVYSHSLFPLITRPTRITTETSTLIDNIFYSEISNSSTLNGLFFTDISDHLPVFTINYRCKIENSQRIFRVQQFNDTTIKKFSNKMETTNWGFVQNNTDGKEAFACFYEKFLNIYEECFPFKYVKTCYHNKKPWLTYGLKKSIAWKNKLYMKQRKCPNSENINTYKTYKSSLNRLLRITERQHYDNILQQHKNNTKKLWSVIKEIINKKRQTREQTQFKIGNDLISDKGVIASKFNSYFINVGKQLAEKIPNNDTDPLSFVRNVPNSIFLSSVSKIEVERIILGLKNASPGYDSVHAKVVKATYKKYIDPLTHILNLSITQGFFPDSMKIAKIIPVFKSGDAMTITNYRPISVLPLFSKILEKLMYNRLMSFIGQNKILYQYQFGFREGHNTNMALSVLMDHILSALDKSELVCGIFLDLKKAFDTVDHEILCRKLFKYGIRGLAMKWIRDYLHARTQYVCYNYVDSQVLKVKCGVPQGSILGPLLFLLYINDIVNVSSSLVPVIYADDTNVFMKGKSIQEISVKMNNELKKIVQWVNSNKLSLNISKTNYMIFRSKGKKLSVDFELKICGTVIERVSHTKFLGIMLDEKLLWDRHVQFIKPKMAKGIGILCKARKILNQKVLVTLYNSIIYPYLSYCVEVWGTAADIHLSSLLRLQKKAIRILTSSTYKAPSDPLFKKLGLLKLSQIFTKSVAILMFKYIRGSLPRLFDAFFVKNYVLVQRTTRNSQKFYIPFCKTEAYKTSIKIQGPKIWNEIENVIDYNCSLFTFKKRLIRYLIQNEKSVLCV